MIALSDKFWERISPMLGMGNQKQICSIKLLMMPQDVVRMQVDLYPTEQAVGEIVELIEKEYVLMERNPK